MSEPIFKQGCLCGKDETCSVCEYNKTLQGMIDKEVNAQVRNKMDGLIKVINAKTDQFLLNTVWGELSQFVEDELITMQSLKKADEVKDSFKKRIFEKLVNAVKIISDDEWAAMNCL